MKKELFLRQLKNNLGTLPRDEIEDIVSDYDEHFEIGKNKGRKETEIAKALGNPKDLAKQFKAQYYVDKADKTASAKNIAHAVFATVGLGFLNLIFVLGPFLGVVGIIIGIYGASIGITVAGLALLVSGIFSSIVYLEGINLLGVSLMGISLMSLGTLLFIGNMYITKGIYVLLIRYLKFNIGIVSPGAKK